MENKNNNGMIAMIIGIVGIVLSCLSSTPLGIVAPIIGLAAGIVAIAMGVKARKLGGNTGMATAGLVTGIIAVVFSGIIVVCVACAICTVGVGVATLAAAG